MERLIVGNDTDKEGWVVARVDKKYGDADFEIVGQFKDKQTAWFGAWRRNEIFADADMDCFYIALCKIDLERG